MKRALTIAALVAVAAAAGFGAGELVYRSVICRDAIGRLFHRGQLLALVHGRAIYEIDLQREAKADAYAANAVHSLLLDANARHEVLTRLIADENIRRASEDNTVSESELQRQFDLLYFQFADESRWQAALQRSGLEPFSLRDRLRQNLRAQKWIEQQVTGAISVDDGTLQQFYTANSADFAQPLRLRASHLFLAAPPITPSEVVQEKREWIGALALRLAQGEDFAQLVAEASEDEGTKKRGGDLGYFSWWRTPPEFFANVSKYRIGETGKPFQSHLGFHLVRLTEIKPPRAMSFPEARPEILLRLTNQRRLAAIVKLRGEMGRRAEYVRR